MKQLTEKEKLIQKFINNHLDYWDKQKKIIEAKKARQHDLYILDKRKKQIQLDNIHNEYNKLLGQAIKDTHTGLIDKRIINRRDELFNVLKNSYS